MRKKNIPTKNTKKPPINNPYKYNPITLKAQSNPDQIKSDIPPNQNNTPIERSDDLISQSRNNIQMGKPQSTKIVKPIVKKTSKNQSNIINSQSNNPPRSFEQIRNNINPQLNPGAYLKVFFSGFGVDFPVPEIMNQPIRNQVISNNVDNPWYRDYSTSDEFRTNFSSNFRNSLEVEVFNRLLANIMGGQYWDPFENKNIPTKKSVLNSLKKFAMSTDYCQVNKNGDQEFPSCCICLNDILDKEITVLIPCGHLLHWKCGRIWLEKHNSCPMCRFELSK